jgi:hypothetical protein
LCVGCAARPFPCSADFFNRTISDQSLGRPPVDAGV